MASISPEGLDPALLIAIISIAVWLVLVVLLRTGILSFVQNRMGANSDEATDSSLRFSAPEVKAPNTPRLLELDVDSDLEAAAKKREELVDQARSALRGSFGADVLGSLAYVVLPLTVAYLFRSGNEVDPEIGGAAALCALLGLFNLLPVALRYLFHRKQFRSLGSHLHRSFELPHMTLVRELVHPRYAPFLQLAIAFAVIPVAILEIASQESAGDRASAAGAVSAILLHGWLRVRLHRRHQSDPNRKLLVLRVFGANESTELTFGLLLRYWQHFGSYFTIVDPSYLRHRYRTYSLRSLVMYAVLAGLWFALCVFLETTFKQTTELWQRMWPLVGGMTVSLALFGGVWLFTLNRAFASSTADIRQRLDETLAKPRALDHTFKSLPMLCYDNTWKVAVRSFLDVSDVVLMDLRGFSRERKGCQYEVDLLLDVIPIRRVVFLADDKNDRELIHQLILDRWESLRTSSPNFAAPDPVARIYVIADQSAEEVQCILDLLLETGTLPPEPALPPTRRALRAPVRSPSTSASDLPGYAAAGKRAAQ